MRTVSLLAVALIAASVTPVWACNLVNAYDAGISGLGNGSYVLIGVRVTGGSHTCYLEVFADRYRCAIVDDCAGSANAFNGWIEGNGLSSVYRVDQVDGNCLKLCPCGP